MKNEMAQALIDIHNLLPYCIEEEAAKQGIPEDVFCSNVIYDLWKIVNRFKSESLEAIVAQPKETIIEECPCCGFYKTLDGLWHAPEKFTPKQLAKRIQKTGEKVCLKQGDP